MGFFEGKRHSWSSELKGEMTLKTVGRYQPREGEAQYKLLLEAKNDDIGSKNTYLWDTKAE